MGYVGKVNAGGSEHLVGSTLYGTCDTAASASTKVVTCPDFTDLIEGVTIHVKFTYGNSSNIPLLNVNSTGAKAVRSGFALNIGYWGSWDSGVHSFTYDGQYWWLNDYNGRIDPSDTSNKMFVLGVQAQDAANPHTHTHDTVYVDTDGHLYSDSKQVVNISGSQALTNKTYNGYTLGAACEKSVGSVASGNTGLVTGGDVYTAIQSAAAGSLQYQGTATSNSDIGTSYHAGWYWIVGSAGGTIAGQTVEAGDMILAHADYSGTLADDLDIVQSNVDRITNSDIDTIVAA